MVDAIYSAMEFYGKGDPYFGGTAADWALYKTEDGRHAFISAADAQRRKLVMAYFPTEAEAEKAGAAASTRKGSISAVPIKPRLEVPTAQISWLSATSMSARRTASSRRTSPTGRKGQARPIRT